MGDYFVQGWKFLPLPTNSSYNHRKGSQAILGICQANRFYEKFIFNRQKQNSVEVHLRKQGVGKLSLPQ